MTKKEKIPQEKSWFVLALEAEMLARGKNGKPMSQRRFAKFLNIPRSTIQRWLENKCQPADIYLRHVAQKLGWKLELGVPVLNPEQTDITPACAVKISIPLMKADDNPLQAAVQAEIDLERGIKSQVIKDTDVPYMTLSQWANADCNPLAQILLLGAAKGWRDFRILVPALFSDEKLAKMCGITIGADFAKITQLQAEKEQLESQLATAQEALRILTDHLQQSPENILKKGGLTREQIEKLKSRQK